MSSFDVAFALVRNIVLDCTLLRWFATHGWRNEAVVAINLARERAKEDELAVVGFLEEHCGLEAS